MTRGSLLKLERQVAELRDLAEGVTKSARPGRGMTTPAIERATLRLFGVHGLDSSGRPLAAAVVERLLELGPDRFSRGIALPLAACAVDYQVEPQELALRVAAGDLDLVAGEELVRQPQRQAAAERQLARWTAEAFERIDANRTARRELSDTLGTGELPWLGAYLEPGVLDEAAVEARAFVSVGADALIARVPAGREFILGFGRPVDQSSSRDMEPPPTGSHRGIAGLRTLLDEMAAERGAYVYLAMTGEALAVPEQAAVAALERADLVFADPLDEIGIGVDPQRAFADHAVAQQIIDRSGASLVLGAGPLLAGRELERGENLTALTRVGRSVAAQAVSAAWARGSGLAGEQVLVQGPFEVPRSADEAAILLAEMLVRRLLSPDHGLAVTEPSDAPPAAWRFALPLCLLAGEDGRLVIQRSRPAEFGRWADDARAGSAFASSLARALERVPPGGTLPFTDDVFAAARALADVAVGTLRGVESQGWAALIGADAAIGSREAAQLGGGSAVVAREYAGPLVIGGS